MTARLLQEPAGSGTAGISDGLHGSLHAICMLHDLHPRLCVINPVMARATLNVVSADSLMDFGLANT